MGGTAQQNLSLERDTDTARDMALSRKGAEKK